MKTMNATTPSDRISKPEKKEDFKSMAKSLAWALLIALIFRSFLFEPFHIPSGSMKPTLLVGDYIFVSKYSYGISRYSFPLGLPLFNGRIGEIHQPERGDIVVFKYPGDTSVNYIKRLIGLPGDRIQVRDDLLYVNDKPVKILPDAPFLYQDDDDGKVRGDPRLVTRSKEILPNGVSHSILTEPKEEFPDNTEVYTVPPKHYFFMGDNRDHSQDSRFLDKVGYVPEENLVGRAELVFFSESANLFKPWTWVSSLRANHEYPASSQ